MLTKLYLKHIYYDGLIINTLCIVLQNNYQSINQQSIDKSTINRYLGVIFITYPLKKDRDIYLKPRPPRGK